MIYIYIYHRRPSNGAKKLCIALNDMGVLSEHGAGKFKNRATCILCWGYSISDSLIDYPHLNGNICGSKFKELGRLSQSGIPTPETVTKVPISATTVDKWIPRLSSHEGGRDILQVHPGGADYYTRFINTTHEFRIHIFRGASVRAGIKVAPGDGRRYHPWIRSHHQGWIIDYGNACQEILTNSVRNIAKQAVDALDYDFGAVDIGVQPNGSPIVFEVNSAPGLDNENTVNTYARHILAWAKESE